MGATARAATWKIQAPAAISMPRAKKREEKSALPVRRGWRKSTGAAAHAPRCLNRKPTLVVRAQPSARKMPRNGLIKEDLDEAGVGWGTSYTHLRHPTRGLE